jgi:hypothetical protein
MECTAVYSNALTMGTVPHNKEQRRQLPTQGYHIMESAQLHDGSLPCVLLTYRHVLAIAVYLVDIPTSSTTSKKDAAWL